MKDERYRQLREYIFDHGRISTSELCEVFHVSAETARRDLKEMENEGLVNRSYGGAVLSDHTGLPNGIPPYHYRSEYHAKEKQAIALETVGLIPDGATVALDSGTTMLKLAELLNRKRNLKVITNDIRIAQKVCTTSGHQVILIGGSLYKNDMITTGFLANSFLSNFSHFDVAVLAADGFSIENGISDHNIEMGALKRELISRADKVIAVIDSSKLSARAPYRICGIKDTDIIVTDEFIYHTDAEKIQKAGVKLIRARVK